MFLILSVSANAWGAEVTAINNIISGNTYYIKGVRSSSTYYLKFTDSSGSQKGTEVSTTNEAIPITFIEVSGGWHLKTPNGNYIAPGTSNGTINVSTTAITVTATDQSSKIRLSIVNNGTTWSIQKNTSAANFGGYKNTQADITLIETSASSPVNPTVTFSNGEYTIGGAALDLSTLWDSNSTGAVTYSVTNAGTTGATVNGTSFTATAAGTCTVQASQAATAIHNAATATATITVTAPTSGGGEGDGECTWELVTDASTLKAGDRVVIVASEYDYALGEDRGNNRAAVGITKNKDNTITINNDVQILTLEVGTETKTFAFQTGDGYLYAAATGSNYLKTKTAKDVHGAFTIEINNGTTNIQAKSSSNRNIIRYNNGNNPKIFSCYSSGQQPICLYKEQCTTETTHYLLRK